MYVGYIHPLGPNMAYFCSTVSRFRDSGHLGSCDFEVTYKGQINFRQQIWSVCSLHTLWAQICLIFALRPAVSKMAATLKAVTLKWPRKVKSTSDSRFGLYVVNIHPVGPNLAYFCSTASRFRNSGHLGSRDLEVTLKGQIDLRQLIWSVCSLHIPSGPKFDLSLLYGQPFPR